MWRSTLRACLNLTLVLLILLSGKNTDAQDVKFLNPDHLTRYDQLEGVKIYQVHGDKEGNVWISSENGLIKYDGYDFESFFHNPNDTTSIGPKYLTTIIKEDKYSNLWIGSYNEVYKYTPTTNSFTTYDLTDFIDQKDLEGHDVLVFDISVDSLGNVFFALVNTRQDGVPQTLLYFDAKTQKIKRLESKNGIDLKNVFRLTTGPGNSIWALSFDGLFRIDEQMKIHEVTSLPNYYFNNHENGGIDVTPDHLFTDIKSDATGVLWLTTNNAELYSFYPTTQTLTLNPISPTFTDQIPSSIHDMIFVGGAIGFDNEGNIYVGTHEGVIKYNPTSKTSWVFEKDKMLNHRIFRVNQDVFGNIWMVGSGGILYKYNPHIFFKTLPLNIDPNTIQSNTYNFFEDKDGTIWQSARGWPSLPTINQINLTKGEILEYSFGTYFPGLSRVFLLGAIEKGKYLFKSTQGMGVFEKGLISSSPESFESILQVNSFLNLLKDSRQNYWWCTGQGIYLQLKDEQKIRHFDLTAFPYTNASSNRVKAAYEGKDGNIWFITIHGLFHYDYEKDKIERYLYDQENGDMMFSQDINALYEENDHVLWIGTWQGGLSKYNLKTKALKTYTTKDGLPSMQIMGILPDEINGDLWLSSGNGISKFNIQEEQFINFTFQNGLKDMVFGDGSYLKTTNGFFIFGALENITYFRPEEIKKYSIAPKVFLTDLKIGAQSIRNIPDKAANFEKSMIENLKLNYRQNSISFEYKAIHFDNPEANQYAYKLENYDEEWRKVGNNRKAFYNNLPAGEYSFLLKAANSYGVWSEPKAFANFSINPPWWATWWSYAFYFLSAIALIFSIYRFQLNRKLDKAEASRLKELDIVKNRLYTNITHEFRTPITVISGMAAQVLENPKEWFNEGLTMIQRNSNRLLELVNQMLDLTKLESGKTMLHNQQGDILTYLKYIVESIHSFAESKKIQVHFHEEEEELMMDFDPEKIQQIMINLLSNAVKFTPEEGNIYVLVRAVSEKNSPQKESRLQIKVKNTGVGISENALPYIFDRFYQVDDSATRVTEGSGIGLALVKELVKLMKGDISVKSKVGKETEFTVILPISNVAPEGQSPLSVPEYKLVGVSTKNKNTNSKQEESEAPLNATKPRIIIVEDNPDVVAYIASCLKDQYEIQVGKDGQEGIELAIENIPDLIITDVMMPIKDGFEFCHALKTDERTSHVPIIMLTAKADLESKIEGLEKGADAYLAKPFHKKELLVRIRKLLELREKLQNHYLSIAGSNWVENTPKAPSREDQFILKLREVVESHLKDFDFTVEEFRREATTMSYSQLLRKITALTGLTPNQFILHIRLNKAKSLLQNPEMNINVVAYETGFKDPAYFSRVFKKEFGMMPLEWKESAKF